MSELRNHQITSSWVIINKETEEVLFETFSSDLVEKLNTVKYEAVPIGKYLGGLNEHQEKTKAYAK